MLQDQRVTSLTRPQVDSIYRVQVGNSPKPLKRLSVFFGGYLMDEAKSGYLMDEKRGRLHPISP